MISQNMEGMDMKKRLACYVMVCGLILLSGCTNTSDQFVAQVQNGDYVKAIETYTTEIQGNAAKELEADEFLSTYLNGKWEDYLAGELENSEFDVTMATYQRLTETIPVSDFEVIQQDYATVERARSTYAEGMNALENEDYVGAISTFAEIPETPDNTYEEAQEKLEQATSSYCEEILDIANASVENGDFDTAISTVNEAVNLVGSMDAFTTFLDETYTEKYETEIAQAAEASDFAKVLDLYEEATENSYVTVSPTMTSTYASSIDQYRQSIITQSIDIYKESGSVNAKKVVDEGLGRLPQDEVLSTLAELYLSCVPATFKDVVEISTHNMYSSERKVTDTIGNTIDASYYTRSMWTGTKSVTLYLDKRFTYLDISFIAEKYFNTFEVDIYGDDVELVNSGTISGEDGITTLSNIDVSGVSQLEVAITPIDGLSTIYMGDEQLYRVLTDEDFAEFL